MGILQSSEPVQLPECLKWKCIKVGSCLMRGPFMLGAPPLAFECHHPVKRTVPCLKLLKGCTLPCPWCRFKRQYQAYIPLLDFNETVNFKVVVCGGKKTWADVKGLPVGTLLALSRGVNVRDTVRFKAWPEAVNVNVLAHWRKRCIEDISPYLFHLWQHRELTEHFGQPYIPSIRVQSNSTPHPTAHDEEGKEIPE